MAQTDFNLYKQDLDPNPEPHEIVREGKTITVTGISAKDFEVNGTSLYEALLEKRTNLRALKQQYIDLVVVQQTCLAGPTDNPPVINLIGNDIITIPVDSGFAPTISLNGANTITLTVGDTLTDPGATATDNEDGDISSQINITGSVNTNVPGIYPVTYSITDSDGNNVNVVREFVVLEDSNNVNVPVITLIGPASIDVNVGDTYVEPGYTATDSEDGNLTSLVTISFFETTNGGNVVPSIDTSTAGQYLITYSVEDSDGNPQSIDRAVNVVVVNDSPVITLIGLASVYINVGDTYVEPGYTATDVEDGDITSLVTISFFETTNGGNVVSSIDTSTAGQYIVSYNVEDSDGNPHGIDRVVNVIASNSPVITLLGPASIDVNIGDTFVDPGYTATDVEDGDLTSQVSVSFFETTNGGNVVFDIDTSTVGQYIIGYYVEDLDGNTHDVNRTVNVVAP